MQISHDHIAELASGLGFDACGIAPAGRVDERSAATFHQWIADGCNGAMDYMARNDDKRLDPRLLLPGAQSVVALAMSYAPAQPLADGQLQFAYYAYGRDYHEVVKERLFKLRDALVEATGADADADFKLCCDTVPILDRYWAWRAGLGWAGKNTNLIVPGVGSYVFLAEIVTTLPADRYDAPMEERCGQCTRCLEACPTHALHAPHRLDARRCLSYLTIEHRGPIPPEAERCMDDCIYGCDRCQKACPHNRKARPTTIEEFLPNERFRSMRPEDYAQLSLEDFRDIFRHSAVKRTKYEGLVRNIQSAMNGSAPSSCENVGEANEK